MIDGMKADLVRDCLVLLIRPEADELETKINEACAYFLNKDYRASVPFDLSLCLLDIRLTEVNEARLAELETIQNNVAPLNIRLQVTVE
ncbi:MAG: hypothetical protein ACOX1W_01900 [Catenisphaera adipataccumulans]|jgi:hypothetical protein|uniref:hypothetical protein n=1 Tax=Catenisphaera adipataccumulans TaxID=700500 RepID=UPI003D8BB8AE